MAAYESQGTVQRQRTEIHSLSVKEDYLLILKLQCVGQVSGWHTSRATKMFSVDGDWQAPFLCYPSASLQATSIFWWGELVYSSGSLIFAVASQGMPLDHLTLVASRVCICRSCGIMVKRETVFKQLLLQKHRTGTADRNVSLVFL